VDPFARTWLGFSATDPDGSFILTVFARQRKSFLTQENSFFMQENRSGRKAARRLCKLCFKAGSIEKS